MKPLFAIVILLSAATTASACSPALVQAALNTATSNLSPAITDADNASSYADEADTQAYSSLDWLAALDDAGCNQYYAEYGDTIQELQNQIATCQGEIETLLEDIDAVTDAIASAQTSLGDLDPSDPSYAAELLTLCNLSDNLADAAADLASEASEKLVEATGFRNTAYLYWQTISVLDCDC